MRKNEGSINMMIYPKYSCTTKYEAICMNKNQALVEYSKTVNKFDNSHPAEQWITTFCDKNENCSYTNCNCKYGTEKPNLRITRIISKS